MFRGLLKFFLYCSIIVFLIFTLSFFGDQLQRWGDGITQVSKEVAHQKPVSAFHRWVKVTVPRWSRSVRRKLLTFREDRSGKPNLVGYKERSPKLKKTKEKGRVNPPQETITKKERQELEYLLQEDYQ